MEEHEPKEIQNEDSHERKEVKHEGKTEHFSQEKETITDKLRENPWIASTVIMGVILAIVLLGNFGGMTGNVVGENQVEKSLDNFLQARATGAEINSLDSYNDYLYQADISLQGQEIPLYVTKDGKYIIQGLTPLELETSTPSTPTPTDVPKSDKPEVELFVMTHCPYGTQAEKGFIPAILEFGDKIDAKIRFVHYFLHAPEEDETPIQVCLREEQPEKFLPYLKCFLEDGDSDRCLTEVKVNKNALNTCVDTNAEDYYAEDSALSKKYGVQGSPTLVINGVQSNAGRSAQAYLGGICDAFNGSPKECSLTLDSANPSAGFGYGTTSGIAQAQC